MSAWGDFLGKLYDLDRLEAAESRKRRQAIELVLFSALAGAAYTIIYVLLGKPSGSYAALAYVIFSLINTYTYQLTKNYNFFRASQLLLLLGLPILNQAIFGGYVNSGGNIIAGILAVIGALIFIGVKAGRIVFALFVLSVIGLTIYELLIVEQSYEMSRGLSVTIFSTTIIFTFTIIYFVVENFIIRISQFQEQLRAEKEKTESLILNILPPSIAEELKESGFAKARGYASATVVMCDIVEFSTLARQVTPQQLVEELDIYFGAFDDVIEKYRLEKIKTIGDAYMYASGIPIESRNHAIDAVNAAIELQIKVKEIRQSGKITHPFDLRVGVSSGPLVAGVVGKKKFAYDIWGDTVNVAARMEQNGKPDKINISEPTYLLVRNEFKCTPRGKITVKHAGELEMYFVEYKTSNVNSPGIA
jgi:guanylate cyclase